MNGTETIITPAHAPCSRCYELPEPLRVHFKCPGDGEIQTRRANFTARHRERLGLASLDKPVTP